MIPDLIRTVEEFETLDPDTILMSIGLHSAITELHPAHWWAGAYMIELEEIFPLAIIAEGDITRAATIALRAER